MLPVGRVEIPIRDRKIVAPVVKVGFTFESTSAQISG